MSRRKTTEEFKKEVYNLVGNEYTVLEEYKGSKDKIKMKHNKCGCIYKVEPQCLLYGGRCPWCYSYCKNNIIEPGIAEKKCMPRGRKKKTTEEFKKEVYNLVGNEYTVLGEYTGVNNKIKMKHNKCGCIYKVEPQSFLHDRRCPWCYSYCEKNVIKPGIAEKKRIHRGHNKKTTKEFKKEVYDLVGNEYSVLGEYNLSSDKIKIKHNKCGNTYEQTANDFLCGHRCPYCSHRHKYTTEEFKKKVYDLVGNEYTVLGEYTGSKNKIKIKHNKCGKAFEIRPNSFNNGARCSWCNGNHKYTQEEFENKVHELYGNRYTVIGKYINSRNKIKMKCNKCNSIYYVNPRHFLRYKNYHHCK